MRKVAILIDGEWFRRRLEYEIPEPDIPHGITAEIMYRNAKQALEPDEDLFRMFYYDCRPHGDVETNPISQQKVDFRAQRKFEARSRFIDEIGALPFVALRLGVTKVRGWTVSETFIKRAVHTRQVSVPGASDVFLSLEQKGVDMRIGIDVATLSLKRIVERIVLISGDTDMIPAIKLARREGLQVILVRVGSQKLSHDLTEDCDIIRAIKPKGRCDLGNPLPAAASNGHVSP